MEEKTFSDWLNNPNPIDEEKIKAENAESIRLMKLEQVRQEECLRKNKEDEDMLMTVAIASCAAICCNV